jgi:hypothetical protein
MTDVADFLARHTCNATICPDISTCVPYNLIRACPRTAHA